MTTPRPSCRTRDSVSPAVQLVGQTPFVGVGVGGVADENLNQFTFPMSPPLLDLSKTTRIVCWPAEMATPVFVSVFHDCQPPVLASVIGPVLSTPSIST